MGEELPTETKSRRNYFRWPTTRHLRRVYGMVYHLNGSETTIGRTAKGETVAVTHRISKERGY